MRTKITIDVVRKLANEDRDIWDAKYPGLVLRCRASGKHTYRVTYGRGKWLTLGRVDVLTPDEARGKARDELSAIAKGRDPKAARQQAKAALTLRAFVDQQYEPWALEHLKRGKETVQRIRTVFAPLLDLKLPEITTWTVEKWRAARLKQTPKPKSTTMNDYVTLLKNLLTKAVRWNVLASHPLHDVKLLKADKTGRIRYLSADEEQRLRQALTARDEARQARRDRANAWRRERGYKTIRPTTPTT